MDRNSFVVMVVILEGTIESAGFGIVGYSMVVGLRMRRAEFC